MNSTLCSIILLTTFYQLSNTIDWDKVPHGKIMKYEEIVNVPDNMILSEINGGNISLEQYHLAMKIRSYKYLYLLLIYTECELENDQTSTVISVIQDSKEHIINFMNHYNINIYDLEKYKLVSTDLKHFKNYLYILILFDNDVFKKIGNKDDALENNKDFILANKHKEEVSLVDTKDESLIETEAEHYQIKLKEEINSMQYFRSLFDKKEFNKYFPSTTFSCFLNMSAIDYLSNKIKEIYNIPYKK
ncbi:uncharacterized protein LOC126893509 [Daktulosphaira vitifoliae]|uniref:uncharacterized protein LOC126893509 n=1 Tax=Daktulosphaira vitifoliae TaxID=58002 RepID=UPI0021A9962B|nr:uncharacterized protein LOC126893509 [Daktulosphaira vitifoliae]